MNAVGSYIDRDSVIHHLHPVTKNLLFIGTFVICLLTNHPAILAGLFLGVVLIGTAARLPIGQSLKLLKSAADCDIFPGNLALYAEGRAGTGPGRRAYGLFSGCLVWDCHDVPLLYHCAYEYLLDDVYQYQ